MTPRNPASATQDVRSAILTEATRLFEANGVDGLSMRQIAGAIGYSATTIYLHFQNKDHLMYAVCEAGFEEFGAALGAAAATSTDPLEQLRAAGRAYIDFALTHPMHYDVMFIRPKAFAIGERVAGNDDLDGVEPESFQANVRLVTACMAAGRLKPDDPREIGTELWSVLHGVAALAVSMNDQMTMFEPDAVRARGERVVNRYLSTLIA